MYYPKINFQIRKASFEIRKEATPLPVTSRSRSKKSPSAEMSSEKPSKLVVSFAQSIDSVLDSTDQFIHPSRKFTPSWIGPPRTERVTTSEDEMAKRGVTIKYSSTGLQPPVYIFTNLSDPAWEAVEMESEEVDNGDYAFSKTFNVEVGEYQYKFRLGSGDWSQTDLAAQASP